MSTKHYTTCNHYWLLVKSDSGGPTAGQEATDLPAKNVAPCGSQIKLALVNTWQLCSNDHLTGHQTAQSTLCFKKKFTLLLFAITKSDVDRFQ